MLLALLEISNSKESESFEITFTPDPDKFTKYFTLGNQILKFTLSFSGKIEPEKIEAAQTLGSTMSGLNSYSSTGIESSSLALSLLSSDPSGSLMKPPQMMKIYCRFRFFNVNFGAQLNTYFDSSA